MIPIPTKSVNFAHCGLVFVDKASTDGEEQQPSSLTGGLPNLQQAAIQPYRRPTHPRSKHPNPTAKHPNPAAEATDAAEAIIRDYGITN